MTRSRRRIVRIALFVGIALAPVWIVAQQRGGNNPFPGGTNPDGSLRPSAPVTRSSRRTRTRSMRCSSPAASRSASDSCPSRRAPARPRWSTRRAAAAKAPASRSTIPARGKPMSSPTRSRRTTRRPRDSREAAHAGARGRHRPRADLQDVQGSAHLHDERRRHRLGAQPQRLPARRRAAEGIRVHLVQRRRAADDHG